MLEGPGNFLLQSGFSFDKIDLKEDKYTMDTEQLNLSYHFRQPTDTFWPKFFCQNKYLGKTFFGQKI